MTDLDQAIDRLGLFLHFDKRSTAKALCLTLQNVLAHDTGALSPADREALADLLRSLQEALSAGTTDC
jgi:hypothetical protein